MLFGLTACKKEQEYQPGDTTFLSGYVVDVSNLEPIANAEVQLIKSVIRSPASGICCYAIRNKIFTDENGYFEYAFKHHPDSIYDIATTAPGYSYNYASGPGGNYPLCITGMASVNKGFINEYNDEKACSFNNFDRAKEEGIVKRSVVRLAPFGTLRVHVKNVPPSNSSDQLRINYENGPFSTLSGAFVNEILENPRVRANRYARIRWTTVIQGQLTSYEDSIYVPKGEVVTYLLEY